MQLLDREQQQEVTQKLEIVRRNFPMPFSMFAGELLHEISAREPNWSRIFSVQIDLFEGCVSFFSFVLFAELECHSELSLKSSLNDLKTFRSGKKLSTGHWWSLLRGMSKDLVGQKNLQFSDATQVALNLFYPNKQLLPAKLHGFSTLLNSVPSIRNQIKGHSYTPSLEQYAEHAIALLDITMDFLSVIQTIDRSTVFYVAQCIATTEEEFQLAAVHGVSNIPATRVNASLLKCRSPLASLSGALPVMVSLNGQQYTDTSADFFFLRAAPRAQRQPEQRLQPRWYDRHCHGHRVH